jgi:hypothetical protein
MSSFVCDKCGKECKDKRGLGIHYNKCDGSINFECKFCNQEFANAYSLSMHSTRCKTMKSRKETMTKEEWLIDNQLNGDDGTGFNDYKEKEGASE